MQTPAAEHSEDKQREELLAALKRLEKSRPDRIGLAGDLIGTGMGVAGGVAASGSIAAVAGATTILGSSTLGGALGGIFVASTPVGWVVGAGLAGGALAYGATRLIRSGEAADQSKKSMYQRLKSRVGRRVEEAEVVAGDVPVQHYEIREKDAYYDFVGRLGRAVELYEVSPERAERLLGAVTAGDLGFAEANELLRSSHSENQDERVKAGLGQWLTLDAYRDLLKRSLNSEVDPDLGKLDDYLLEHVPRVWLLGKTGAGKSSLIGEITGQSDVEIGNGFEPCTSGITRYLYPAEQPIMEFLDTRGLSEAGYVADADILEASEHTHAIIAVIKIDDPEQSAVIETLSKLGKSSRDRLLVVYTASHGLNDPMELERAVNHQHRVITKHLKKELAYVVVDFPNKTNVDQLREKLADLMPSAEAFVRQTVATTHEEQVYLNQREKIIWHSGAAASADIVPGVGLVAVPTVQVKMLYQLADAYDLNWQKQEVLEFIGCLGAGFSVSYGSKLLVTQLGRLIPVWGQTIGQATAMALSFGLTFALGRGACYYMYQKRHGREVDLQKLKSVYEQALKRENLGIQASNSE